LPYNIKPATSSLLIEETWSGPVTNGQRFTFSYNSSNEVMKIEQWQWQGPTEPRYDTTLPQYQYTNYEYSNGLATKSWNNGDPKSYYLYNYTKGLLTNMIFYTTVDISVDSLSHVFRDNTPIRYCSYVYDSQNHLKEMRDSSKNGMNYSEEYSYNDSGNIVKLINYQYGGNAVPLKKLKYEWTSFDQKINFQKAINGLPATAVNFGGASVFSSNNQVSVNYNYYTDFSQPFGLPDTVGYTYEYNDEGLPTKMVTGPWIVTFKYKKL
jgi:hypothetical protein